MTLALPCLNSLKYRLCSRIIHRCLILYHLINRHGHVATGLVGLLLAIRHYRTITLLKHYAEQVLHPCLASGIRHSCSYIAFDLWSTHQMIF